MNSYLARYATELPPGAPAGDPWELVNLVMQQHADGRVGPTTSLGTAVDAATDLLRALGIRSVREPSAAQGEGP